MLRFLRPGFLIFLVFITGQHVLREVSLFHFLAELLIVLDLFWGKMLTPVNTEVLDHIHHVQTRTLAIAQTRMHFTTCSRNPHGIKKTAQERLRRFSPVSRSEDEVSDVEDVGSVLAHLLLEEKTGLAWSEHRSAHITTPYSLHTTHTHTAAQHTLLLATDYSVSSEEEEPALSSAHSNGLSGHVCIHTRSEEEMKRQYHWSSD